MRGGDAAALRRLRLQALADAPAAFARTVETESAYPDSHWSELAQTAPVFVAVRGDEWVGMAGGGWSDQDNGVAMLWGLWVDPALRGSGLGERLVAEVDGWATVNGARLLRLGIMLASGDVERFYTRLGFARTGEVRPLPWDGSRTFRFLARPVPGA